MEGDLLSETDFSLIVMTENGCTDSQLTDDLPRVHSIKDNNGTEVIHICEQSYVSGLCGAVSVIHLWPDIYFEKPTKTLKEKVSLFYQIFYNLLFYKRFVKWAESENLSSCSVLRTPV